MEKYIFLLVQFATTVPFEPKNAYGRMMNKLYFGVIYSSSLVSESLVSKSSL